MTTALRQRSREILRAELAASAADFCLEHGFDEVTVDEIAQAVGISRASLFRYFTSKEDIIGAAMRPFEPAYAEHIRNMQPPTGTPALDVARDALRPVVDAARKDPLRQRRILEMVRGTPALRAHTAYARTQQRRELETALADWMSDPDAARAVATTVSAALELGWNLWVADSEKDLADVIDYAFDLIEHVGDYRIGVPPESASGS